MKEEQNREQAIEKLKELIEGIDFCMLTTVSGDIFRSRPMSTQQFEFDGDLWFFTSDETAKAEQVNADDRVSVTYTDPADNKFVSVFGRGHIIRDRAKMEELWNPILKAWFPDGLEQKDLALLRVSVEEAEYWDMSSSTLVQIAGFVKSLVSGKQIDAGDHASISM